MTTIYDKDGVMVTQARFDALAKLADLKVKEVNALKPPTVKAHLGSMRQDLLELVTELNGGQELKLAQKAQEAAIMINELYSHMDPQAAWPPAHDCEGGLQWTK